MNSSTILECEGSYLPKARARKDAVVEVECGSCAPAAAAAVERPSEVGSMNTRDERPVKRTPLVLLVVPRDVSRELKHQISLVTYREIITGDFNCR